MLSERIQTMVDAYCEQRASATATQTTPRSYTFTVCQHIDRMYRVMCAVTLEPLCEYHNIYIPCVVRSIERVCDNTHDLMPAVDLLPIDELSRRNREFLTKMHHIYTCTAALDDAYVDDELRRVECMGSIQHGLHSDENAEQLVLAMCTVYFYKMLLYFDVLWRSNPTVYKGDIVSFNNKMKQHGIEYHIPHRRSGSDINSTFFTAPVRLLYDSGTPNYQLFAEMMDACHRAYKRYTTRPPPQLQIDDVEHNVVKQKKLDMRVIASSPSVRHARTLNKQQLTLYCIKQHIDVQHVKRRCQMEILVWFRSVKKGALVEFCKHNAIACNATDTRAELERLILSHA